MICDVVLNSGTVSNCVDFAHWGANKAKMGVSLESTAVTLYVKFSGDLLTEFRLRYCIGFSINWKRNNCGTELRTNPCRPETEAHRELLGNDFTIFHLSEQYLVFLDLLYS